MSTAHVQEHSDLPPPSVEEVSDGIFAYIQLDGSWGLNNSGFLVGSDGVTVVDTCFTERRSRMFHDAIRRQTDRPLRTLVNTPHHGAPTHGNHLFLPPTPPPAPTPGTYFFPPAPPTGGHELCRQEVIATGHGATGLFPGVEWGEIRIAPPFLSFEERLNLYVDDLKVELIFVGPAHTTNDVVAWVPERKVLFAGDVVFNGGTSFVIMGSIAGSLEALERLRALGPQTIVPGHGPVCGPEVLDGVADYLRCVREAARRGFEEGLTPLATAQRTELGRFGELLDRDRLVGNLHRAYSELRGEPRGTPLALGAVVPDMIAYNGGQMPRCLA